MLPLLAGMLGGGGGGGGMGFSSSSSATSGDAKGESYNVIDNSMVIGGGGSLTKGSVGTPAAQAAVNSLGLPTWAIAVLVSAAVVMIALFFRR